MLDSQPIIGYNAGKCDVIKGPCSCGAWHTREELLTPLGIKLAEDYLEKNKAISIIKNEIRKGSRNKRKEAILNKNKRLKTVHEKNK